MKMRGVKTLRQALGWLRSRATDSGLILAYHRVADGVRDPYGIGVTPDCFEQQLQVIRDYCRPTVLRDLVAYATSEDNLKGRVAVTIDDGYADCLYNVKSLLERYEIPATIFVTTGYLGRTFWWDELAEIIFSATTVPRAKLRNSKDAHEWVVDGGGKRVVAEDEASARRVLLESTFKALLPLPHRPRQALVNDLRRILDIDSSISSQEQNRALRSDEVQQLAGSALIEIGAHTITHPDLSTLEGAEQQQEIEGSKMHLERIIGKPVTTFSYPHGGSMAQTRSLVRASGYYCACTSNNGVVWSGVDRFQLPRFWIPDWDGEKLGRWLRWWLRP